MNLGLKIQMNITRPNVKLSDPQSFVKFQNFLTKHRVPMVVAILYDDNNNADDQSHKGGILYFSTYVCT